MNEASGPLLVFSTGLLAVVLNDRDVADYVVRSPIVTKLLQRLHTLSGPTSPTGLGGFSGPTSPTAGGTSPKGQTPGGIGTASNAGATGRGGSTAGNAEEPNPPQILKDLTPEDYNRLEVRYCLSCLSMMGEYQDILAPMFHENGLDLIMKILKREEIEIKFYAIECVSKLLAHKKFSMTFVQAGGVEVLLKLTDSPQVSDLIYFRVEVLLL